MVYGYDDAVAMPIVDLYDDGMMNQYINTVQKDYEQGLLEQKQFNQEFGDLASPSSKLNQAFYNATRGRVYDVINKAWKQGIDLTRSAQGRAIISNLINSVPYNKIADWKKDAEAMNLYQKTKSAMIANGTYNDAYQQYYQKKHGLVDINDYDPYSGQGFNQMAPAEYKTLQQFVEPEFEQVKDSDLSPTQVRSFGVVPSANYQYKGVSKDMLAKSLQSAMPAMRGNDIYEFYREQAKQDLINKNARNPHYKPTEQEINNQFLQNAVATGHTRYTKEADDFAKMAVNHAYDIDTENRRFSHDVQLASMKAASKSTSSSKDMNDPFVEAVRLNTYGKAGSDISYQYTPESLSAGRIQPASAGVRLNKGIKGTKSSKDSYTILPGAANGSNGNHLLYSYNSAITKGKKVVPLKVGKKWQEGESMFLPSGRLSSKGVYKNGKLVGYRHFIIGQMVRQVPNGFYTNNQTKAVTPLFKTVRLNSGKPIAMEVKRKEFNESDKPNTNNY